MITLPLLTTFERISLNNPVKGMVVFDTDLEIACIYNGTNWQGINIITL